MAGPFDKYAKLYTDKKSQLFPLMEKYSGKSLTGATNGEAIAVYLDLLKNNPSFAAEITALLTSSGYNNAIDPITGAEQLLSSIAGIFSSGTTQRASTDAQFANAVLSAQQSKNTQTYLIVAGITLASLSLIGVAIFMVIKKRRT